MDIYTLQLKQLRKLHNYTQADLAQILSIRQEQYSRYESGVRELPIHLLIRLCKLYKVSADYILNI